MSLLLAVQDWFAISKDTTALQLGGNSLLLDTLLFELAVWSLLLASSLYGLTLSIGRSWGQRKRVSVRPHSAHELPFNCTHIHHPRNDSLVTEPGVADLGWELVVGAIGEGD